MEIGHKYKQRIFQFIYKAKKPVKTEILLKALKIPGTQLKLLLLELQQEGKIRKIDSSRCRWQNDKEGFARKEIAGKIKSIINTISKKI